MPNEKTIIRKGASFAKPPNLSDYAQARRDFSWTEARGRLDGLPDGGLNIAYEAVDRLVSLSAYWPGKRRFWSMLPLK